MKAGFEGREGLLGYEARSVLGAFEALLFEAGGELCNTSTTWECLASHFWVSCWQLLMLAAGAHQLAAGGARNTRPCTKPSLEILMNVFIVLG